MLILENLPDGELLSLVKADNPKAFGVIYDRYKGILAVHAYKKLGNFEEAKDIVQEVFSTFWNKRSDIETAANVPGYLYTIASHKVLNFIKHRNIASRYASSFQEMAVAFSSPTESLVRERNMAEIIQREIDALHPKMRIVFLLSREEHLTHREIAEKLGISEFTVKNHIKAALKILRLRLGIIVYICMLLKF